MLNKLHEINEHTKHMIDWASIATVLGTIMQFLPAAAALWSIVWSTIRIYETKTIQDWLAARKAKKDAQQVS
jgi:hypothetical protein